MYMLWLKYGKIIEIKLISFLQSKKAKAEENKKQREMMKEREKVNKKKMEEIMEADDSSSTIQQQILKEVREVNKKVCFIYLVLTM